MQRHFVIAFMEVIARAAGPEAISVNANVMKQPHEIAVSLRSLQ